MEDTELEHADLRAAALNQLPPLEDVVTLLTMC